MNRWLEETGGGRGPSYEQRFAELQRSGVDVHGEAALVASLVPAESRVLDAGCGTGRVAIELARRSYDVAGVDVDASMLDVARSKAPQLPWHLADLGELDLAGSAFDLALLAGNVMVFVAPGTEGAVVRRVASHVRRGGLVVAGFSLQAGRLGLDSYDELAASAGLRLLHRWATWDRQPYSPGGDYAVSVHVNPGAGT